MTTPGDVAITITAADVLATQRRCPLVRAALRIDDPEVLRVVLRVHPSAFCPAARRFAREQVAGGRG